MALSASPRSVSNPPVLDPTEGQRGPGLTASRSGLEVRPCGDFFRPTPESQAAEALRSCGTGAAKAIFSAGLGEILALLTTKMPHVMVPSGVVATSSVSEV